jgi:hypothetical protein
MRKPLKTKDFAGRFGLAVSLVIVLTAIACSTYTHDAVQTNAPAPAVLKGASLTTAPPINSQGPASMTTPTTEALAITAANQGYDGRFLGYIEGIGPSPSGNYTPPTGQLIPPSLYANPELTVNSSISSAPTPVITSGAGETGGVFIGGVTGTTAAVTATPTTAALTAAGTTSSVVSAAPIFATAATVATPTNTANILAPGQFAAGPGSTSTTSAIVSSGPLPVTQGTVLANGNTGTLTPTISSAALPSPTVASNPPVTLATTNRTSTTAKTSSTTAPLTASAVASARGNIAPIVSTSNLTTITNLNGGLRVTTANASTSSSATTSGGGNIAPINFGAITASGMTSSSTIDNSTTTAPVTVAPITNESTPRRRAVQASSSGTTEPATQPAIGRLRAVRAPSNVPPHQHAVRVTSAADGTVVITNRDQQLSRDQQNPQQ